MGFAGEKERTFLRVFRVLWVTLPEEINQKTEGGEI